MDGVNYSNFMMAFRGMAEDIEKIVERLDKMIELQEASRNPIINLPTLTIEGSKTTSELCSTCGGCGYIRNPDPSSTIANVICQTCGGSGWV